MVGGTVCLSGKGTAELAVAKKQEINFSESRLYLYTINKQNKNNYLD